VRFALGLSALYDKGHCQPTLDLTRSTSNPTPREAGGLAKSPRPFRMGDTFEGLRGGVKIFHTSRGAEIGDAWVERTVAASGNPDVNRLSVILPKPYLDADRSGFIPPLEAR
jgi:hypothetical protein